MHRIVLAFTLCFAVLPLTASTTKVVHASSSAKKHKTKARKAPKVKKHAAAKHNTAI